MSIRRALPRIVVIPLVGSLFLTSSVFAGDIEVIYSEAPGHPTAVVPGARDLNGDLVTTEFKALEVLSVSPDGSDWILKARNWLGSDLETMLMRGSGVCGKVLAQEGQPVHDGEPNEVYDFFGSSPPHYNELNQFVYTARARGGDSTTKQKGIFYDGTDFFIVRAESDPALGLADDPGNPTGDELFGNSFGSFHLLNNGVIGSQDSTIQNIHSSYRPAIFYDATAFKQSNVSTIGPSIWDSQDSNKFWTTPDGTRWIAQGDDIQVTTVDDILVVDDVVVLREGSVIPGYAITVAAVFQTKLLPNGDWFSRGDDPGDNDWAVRSGTLIAATGDPITTGSGEHWADVFYSFTGNTVGDWVIAGNTDNGDIQTDSVIVLNGTDVVVREGDPVDLDGNGSFDDDAYIGRGVATSTAFHADDIFLTDDLMLYFFASLRNAAGEDLGEFGTGGDAFMRIDLSPGCPEPGGSGNYCTADIYGDDCVVDIQDLSQLLAYYGETTCVSQEHGDIYPASGDGVVNIQDLSELLAQYGDDCN